MQSVGCDGSGLRRGSTGVLRYIIGYADRFLMVRDNERHFIDRTTLATRRAYLEVGRRGVERGLINDRDDVFFLGAEELYDLFAAGHATLLTGRSPNPMRQSGRTESRAAGRD
jgi:hypothetical protein